MIFLSKIRNTIRIAYTTYRSLIVQPRLLLFGGLLIIIYNLVIIPFFARSDDMMCPYNAMEPFIAVCNSGQLLLFVPALFLILVSDYPEINAHTKYIVCRIGRKKWLFSQILAVQGFILTYIFALLISCIGMSFSNGTLSLTWSDAILKYLSTVSLGQYDAVFEYLSPNIYNHFSFVSALCHTALLLWLYLNLLTSVITVFRLLGKKILGLLIAYSLIICGVVLCAIRSEMMWLMPMAHTVTWLHYQPAFREPIVPLWASYLYFFAGIAICLLAAFLVLKRAELCNQDTL